MHIIFICIVDRIKNSNKQAKIDRIFMLTEWLQ